MQEENQIKIIQHDELYRSLITAIEKLYSLNTPQEWGAALEFGSGKITDKEDETLIDVLTELAKNFSAYSVYVYALCEANSCDELKEEWERIDITLNEYAYLMEGLNWGEGCKQYGDIYNCMKQLIAPICPYLSIAVHSHYETGYDDDKSRQKATLDKIKEIIKQYKALPKNSIKTKNTTSASYFLSQAGVIFNKKNNPIKPLRFLVIEQLLVKIYKMEVHPSLSAYLQSVSDDELKNVCNVLLSLLKNQDFKSAFDEALNKKSFASVILLVRMSLASSSEKKAEAEEHKLVVKNYLKKLIKSEEEIGAYVSILGWIIQYGNYEEYRMLPTSDKDDIDFDWKKNSYVMKDQEVMCPLHLAIDRGNVVIVSSLLNKFPVLTVCKFKKANALEYAVKKLNDVDQSKKGNFENILMCLVRAIRIDVDSGVNADLSMGVNFIKKSPIDKKLKKKVGCSLIEKILYQFMMKKHYGLFPLISGRNEEIVNCAVELIKEADIDNKQFTKIVLDILNELNAEIMTVTKLYQIQIAIYSKAYNTHSKKFIGFFQYAFETPPERKKNLSDLMIERLRVLSYEGLKDKTIDGSILLLIEKLKLKTEKSEILAILDDVLNFTDNKKSKYFKFSGTDIQFENIMDIIQKSSEHACYEFLSNNTGEINMQDNEILIKLMMIFSREIHSEIELAQSEYKNDAMYMY